MLSIAMRVRNPDCSTATNRALTLIGFLRISRDNAPGNVTLRARRDILLDSTATAPNTVTTAVTMVRIALEIPATVMGMATDLATAMQANTAPPLDRG